MTIALVRLLGALTGVGTALVSVVTLPLLLARELWHWGWVLLDGQIPRIDVPSDMNGLMHLPPLSWMGAALPPAPAYSSILTTSVLLLVPLIVCLGLIHLFVPMQQRLRAVAGCKPTRMRKHNEIYQGFIDEISPRWKRRKIDLYALPVEGVVAFAMSAPFNRHAVALSQELLTETPEPIVKWILAHEVAHIRYGDTNSGSFWMLTIRSIHVFTWLRNWIARLGLKLVAELPIIRLLFWPLLLAVKLLILAGRVGRWVGTKVFLLFDRWASRRIELRADRYAAELLGPEPGIHMFQALQKIGSFEPTFGLFAAHPSHQSRIEALLALQRTEPRKPGGITKQAV